MATQTITISSKNPVQLLTNTNLSTSTVANLDAVNSVFLGNDPSGTMGAFELTAGSVISWDKERALYAYISVAPVKVVVLDNGGNFNNGVAVANALISSGLAVDIAAAIVASALAANTAAAVAASSLATNTASSISGSTLASSIATLIAGSSLPGNTATAVAGSALAANTALQIQTAGVPAIDNPIQLYFGTLADGIATTAIDVKRYQSVVIQLSQDGTGDLTPRAIVIYFDNGYQYIVCTGGAFIPVWITLPAEGATMTVRVTTAAAIQVAVTVTGSYRAVPGMSYEFIGGIGTVNNGVGYNGGTLVSTVDYLSWVAASPANFGGAWTGANGRAGHAHIAARHEGSAGTFTILLQDRKTNAAMHNPISLTAGTRTTADLILPARPWNLYLAAAGITGYVDFTMGID